MRPEKKWKRAEKRITVSENDLVTSAGRMRIVMSYLEHQTLALVSGILKTDAAGWRSDESGVMTQY